IANREIVLADRAVLLSRCQRRDANAPGYSWSSRICRVQAAIAKSPTPLEQTTASSLSATSAGKLCLGIPYCAARSLTPAASAATRCPPDPFRVSFEVPSEDPAPSGRAAV